LKKQNDARLLLLEYRKLLGEEGITPYRTRALIERLVQDRRLAEVEEQLKEFLGELGVKLKPQGQ
jgi:hypothetical protein